SHRSALGNAWEKAKSSWNSTSKRSRRRLFHVEPPRITGGTFHVEPLFADAEAREDAAEQIVSAHFTSDPAQRPMREPELFRCQFKLLQDFLRPLDMPAGGIERLDVSLPRDEYRLGLRLPAGGLQQPATQRFDALASLRGNGEHRSSPVRVRKPAGQQVDLVH